GEAAEARRGRGPAAMNLRLAFAATSLIACGLVACTSTPPPSTPAPAPSTAPVAETPPTPGDTPPPKPGPPPSGLFSARANAVRDTCSTKLPSHFTVPSLIVYGHTNKKGQTILNLPLAASGATVIARSDVIAESGFDFTSNSKPDLACPTYEVTHALKVK